MEANFDHRDRILSVAEQQFYSSGFQKVSVDDIVAELRVSKSTLYGHFSSKAKLVEAIVRRIDEKLSNQLKEIVAATKMDLATKLIEVARYQGSLLSGIGSRFFWDLRVHAPELYEIYEEGRKGRIENYYGKLIDEGIKTGQIRKDMDRDFLLISYLWISDLPCLSRFSDKMPYIQSEAFEKSIRLFLEGALIRKKSSKKKPTNQTKLF